MLKIKDNVSLEILKKYKFTELIMNKKLYYIYIPNGLEYASGNSIKIYADKTIFDMDRQIGMDRIIEIRYIDGSLDGEKIIDKLYDLIQAGLVEKVSDK